MKRAEKGIKRIRVLRLRIQDQKGGFDLAQMIQSLGLKLQQELLILLQIEIKKFIRRHIGGVRRPLGLLDFSSRRGSRVIEGGYRRRQGNFSLADRSDRIWEPCHGAV